MWRSPGCSFWTKELYLHPCAPLTSILILYRPNYVRESRRKSHIVATNLQATATVVVVSLQNHTVGSIVFWRSSLLSWNIPKNLSNIWRNHIFPLSVFKVTLNCTKHNGNTLCTAFGTNYQSLQDSNLFLYLAFHPETFWHRHFGIVIDVWHVYLAAQLTYRHMEILFYPCAGAFAKMSILPKCLFPKCLLSNCWVKK